MIQKSYFLQLITLAASTQVEKYRRSGISKLPGLFLPFKTSFFRGECDGSQWSSFHTASYATDLFYMPGSIQVLFSIPKRWIYDLKKIFRWIYVFNKPSLHNFAPLLCQLYPCFHFCISVRRGEGIENIVFFAAWL